MVCGRMWEMAEEMEEGGSVMKRKEYYLLLAVFLNQNFVNVMKSKLWTYDSMFSFYPMLNSS